MDVFGSGSSQSELEALVGNVKDIAVQNENLILLATGGNVDGMKAYLLSEKGGLNEQDTNGYSALMAAASYCQLEVVKYLLSCSSIDIHLVDFEGDSALHYCADVDCAREILKAGGDINMKNVEGLTPKDKIFRELEEDEEGNELEENELEENEQDGDEPVGIEQEENQGDIDNELLKLRELYEYLNSYKPTAE